MTMDFNDAGQQFGDFDLIPDGAFAPMRMTIRPGNVGDGGWLTQSKSSDAQYLSAEFVILEGEYAKRKFWGNLTVSGGKVDEKGASKGGNITKATLRAIIESARGIDPSDESDHGKKARIVSGYDFFNGVEFIGQIGIEKGRDGYKDKNKLGLVITPDKPEYKQRTGMASGTSSDGGSGHKPASDSPPWQAAAAAQAPLERSKSAPAWAS